MQLNTRPSDSPSHTVQRFFFIHVMKTGGTSFAVHHLAPAFDEQAVFPNAVDDEMSYLLDTSPYWRIDALRELSAQRRDRTELYRGHYPFCATEIIGDHGLITLTLLRDPVERVVSYLKHCRTYHPQHSDMTLEEIYEERPWIDGFATNHQTKVFSLTAADDPKYCYQPLQIDRSRLALAKANLAEVDIVGTQDRFTEFVEECGRRFGWPTTPRPKHRTGEAAPVSESLRMRIETDNEIDREFYEYARSRAV